MIEASKHRSLNRSAAASFRKLTQGCAAAAGFISVAALCGWLFDVQALRSIFPQFTSMSPHAALCFGLCALASWWSRSPATRKTRHLEVIVALAIVSAFSAFTLYEYVAGWKAGIDEFLFRGPQHFGTGSVTRFSPLSDVNFLFISIALLLLHRRRTLARLCLTFAATTSLAALIGYLYRLVDVYSPSSPASLPIHSVLGFLLLCFAAACACPSPYIRYVFQGISEGAVSARLLVSGALLLPLILGWVTLQGFRWGAFGIEFILPIFTVLLIIITEVLLRWAVRARWRVELRRDQLTRERDHYVSELQARNQELGSALDAAQKSSEMKDQFLANVSHELRTPLNGILGMNSLLEETELTSEQREFAAVVRESGTVLLALVNDILDFAKIESGTLEIRNEEFEIRPIVSQVLRMTESIRSSQINFSWNISADVPRLLNGDPIRLKQILTNLVGNAVKFTHQGGVSVSVALTQASAPPVIEFRVRDTGIGIKPDVQRKLFRPFVQGDGSSTRNWGGTGLGLAISKRLVELMGGSIGLESEFAVGSTFWFTIPLNVPLPETNKFENGEPVETSTARELWPVAE